MKNLLLSTILLEAAFAKWETTLKDAGRQHGLMMGAALNLGTPGVEYE